MSSDGEEERKTRGLGGGEEREARGPGGSKVQRVWGRGESDRKGGEVSTGIRLMVSAEGIWEKEGGESGTVRCSV